jgi:hypothetical protein
MTRKQAIEILTDIKDDYGMFPRDNNDELLYDGDKIVVCQLESIIEFLESEDERKGDDR